MNRNFQSKHNLILPKLVKRGNNNGASFKSIYKSIFDSTSCQLDRSDNLNYSSKTKALFYTPSRSLNSYDFVLNNKIDSTINSKCQQEHLPYDKKRDEKFYLKKFRLLVITARFSIYWCRWAFNNYNKRLHRFISFVQLTQPSNLDHNVKKESNRDIEIRAEMMNFDVSFYKSSRRLDIRLDSKTISILCLSNLRTKDDLTFLKNTFSKLIHMKCIKSLAPSLQEKLFKCCWLEIYEPKRIIVCQNHRAERFYMIISGQLVCTYNDLKDRRSRLISLLERGMTFGELPLQDGSFTHNYTISTCKMTELLVITKEDYIEIFLNLSNSNNDDELKNQSSLFDSESKMNLTSTNSENDNMIFLKKLDFFKPWWTSLNNGENNNDKSISFKSIIFPRGKIISKDTSKSKYIFIVKQGSISIIVKVRTNKKTNQIEMTNDEFSNLSLNLNDDYDYESNEFDSHLNSCNYLKKHQSEINELKLNIKTQKLKKFKKNIEIEKEKNKIDGEWMEKNKIEERVQLNEVTKYLNSIKKVETDSSRLIEQDEEKKKAQKIQMRVKLKKEYEMYAKHSSRLEKAKITSPIIVKKHVRFAESDENFDYKTEETNRIKLPEIHSEKSHQTKSIIKNKNKRKEHSQTSNDILRKEVRNEISNDVNHVTMTNNISSLNSNLEKSNNAKNKITSDFDFVDMTKNNNEESIDLINDTSENSEPKSKTKISNSDKNKSKTNYLLIKNLYKGEHVGLTDILYENQPSMQLISNGCECILLAKDQFIKNVTVNYLVELRRMQAPVPKFDLIKQDFKKYLDWRDHSQSELSSYMEKKSDKCKFKIKRII